MSIQFMVIAAPRSATAWASAWLSTERSLCYHDALFHTPLEELDALACDERALGIADTGIWMFPEYLATHPAKKVILHRSTQEINASLRRWGLPTLQGQAHDVQDRLAAIAGLHVDWECLFKDPDTIHRYLFGTVCDLRRHELLSKLNVQVDFEKIDPDTSVTRRMMERLRAAAR